MSLLKKFVPAFAHLSTLSDCMGFNAVFNIISLTHAFFEILFPFQATGIIETINSVPKTIMNS